MDLFQKLCEGRLKKSSASSAKKKEDVSSDRKTKIQPEGEETHADGETEENNTAQTRPDLIRAAAALNGWYTGINTLYKDRETAYVLILHQTGMTPENFNRVCNMLSEYGTGKACTAATEAYLKEHVEVLVADQALQQLLLLNV